MSGIRVRVEWNLEVFNALAANMPELNARFLAAIGAKAKGILRKKYLSGQKLDLTAYPTDKLGRRTITYSVRKGRGDVRIYSYPVNLFEKGRRLRSGARESGKYIITKHLKADVDMFLPEFVRSVFYGMINGAIADYEVTSGRRR